MLAEEALMLSRLGIISRRLAVLVTCGALLAVAGPAVASQAPASSQTTRQQLVDRFDDLLEHKQYAALGEALEREHHAGRGRLSRGWQDRRIRDGGSAYLGFVYSRDLMRSAARSVKGGRSAWREREKLREHAALVAIYTMALLTIDGPRCADASAPSVRSEQLFDLAAEAFSWAAAMPERQRDRIIDQALALEQETAPHRRNDDFICLGGAEAVAQALQDPASRLEPKDGDAAHGVTVTPGNPVEAQFADPEKSRPMQALARRTIRADLCRMLDQMKS